jgi:drug/metabolite transporter (DMT)-like permease
MLFYTASVWGLNVVLIKSLTYYFDEILVSALRIGVACIIIWVIVLFKFGKVPRITSNQMLWIGLGGFFLIYIHQITLSHGLSLTTATNGSLILALNPLLSVILAFFFYKEILTIARVIGVLIGLLGVSIVVLNKSSAVLGMIGWGDFVMLLSTLGYVIGGICIRKIAADLHPFIIAAYMHTIGVFMLLAHSAFTPSFYQLQGWFPDSFAWLLILISGIASTALGNIFWNVGISRIGLGRTTLFLNWLPVSGLIFSVIFLNETVKLVHFIGLVCVSLGVYLGVRKPKVIQEMIFSRNQVL